MEKKQQSPRDLPTDLLPGILSKLPVKSLVRFRSVSKTWRRTIHDPKFVKSYRKRPESQIFFARCCKENAECTVRCRKTLNITEKQFFPSELRYASEVICCNDGLFLFENLERRLILWNPSTRAVQILPQMPQEVEGRSYRNLGIGFDPRVGDYKCVRASLWDKIPSACWVSVYTLGTNSWRMVPFKTKGDKPWCSFLSDKSKACYRGDLYSTAVGLDSDDIIKMQAVSFDLSTEEFRSFDIPDVDGAYIHEATWQLKCAGNEYQLALVGLLKDRGCIWWAQGEGCDITWSKGFSFTSTLPHSKDSYLDVNISGRSEGGDEVDVVLLLRSGSTMMSYNLQFREKKILHDASSPYSNYRVSIRANPYVESLLLFS